MEFNDALERSQYQYKSDLNKLTLENLKESTRVIGYFAYTEAGDVLCDGDACIIGGSEELMKSYIKDLSSFGIKKDIIRKTRFGEITDGMEQSGAYAFDQESHARFIKALSANGVECFSREENFLDPSGKKCFLRFGKVP